MKVRYYFKADSPGDSYRFACSWAVRGCSVVTGTFGTLSNPTATADRYLEIGFTQAAGTLAPGADTGDLQLRFHRTNWQTVRQSDDYSFNGAQTSYANWDRVTAQLAGATVWGTAPEGNDPTDPTDPTDPPGDGQALFDDFDYSSHTDPAISAHGWSVRANSGGPGVPGATWDPSKVTFVSSGGNSVMNLETSTAGTGASTTHTEVLTRATKFRNGTYAARVKFSDAPKSGPDGDHLVQTFFTINDLKAPMADDYAEYDFEYLPNGGGASRRTSCTRPPGKPTTPTPGRPSTSTPSSAGATRAGTTWSSRSTTAPSRTTWTGSTSAPTTRGICPSGRCRSTSTSG